MHGKIGREMQRQLEERMRMFRLDARRRIASHLQRRQEPTHHALEALVDAVLDLGRTYEPTTHIVPFARYVDRLVPSQFTDNSFQYAEYGVFVKSYKLQ